MAYLNNQYIFVETDDIKDDLESTSHPVEEGMELTDSIKNKPISISLNGRIVDDGNVKATTIVSKIEEMKRVGSLIKYRNGNITADNMQIQSFRRKQSNAVHGGFVYDMELKQVRIAKNSYTATETNTATNTNTIGEIVAGSIVVFKGGSVYVSSDAKKAAATRGRSTCKVEIPNSKSSPIRTESWAIHPYHLVSTDGGKVYGWVDKENIEGINTNVNSANSNGTQQISNGSGTAVYHTVKQGQTVWGLVTNNYKELGKNCQWVIDNNPSAFSRKGDPTTLKINAKLLMGYK